MLSSSQPITYYIQKESVAGDNGKLIKKGITKYRILGIWGHVTPPESIDSTQVEWKNFDVEKWAISLGYTILPTYTHP